MTGAPLATCGGRDGSLLRSSSGLALIDGLRLSLRYRELTRAQRDALRYAAERLADAHGRLTIEVRRWAEAAEVSTTTVRAAIRFAVESGLLEREPFFGEYGRQRGSEYRLTIVPDARRGRPRKSREKRAHTVVAFPTQPLKSVRTLGKGWGKKTGITSTARKSVVSVDAKVGRIESALRLTNARNVRRRDRSGVVACWDLSCPCGHRHAHGDRSPSARISVMPDGQVKAACWVCGSGRGSEYWREVMCALGLRAGLAFADWWEWA